MRIKLVNANGEAYYLPEELSVQGWDKAITVPGVEIAGRDGRVVDRELITAKSRNVQVSGTIAGYDKDAIDAIATDIEGWLSKAGPFWLYRHEASPYRLQVEFASIKVSYATGHYDGRVFTLNLAFEAADPHWYYDQATADICFYPSGRVEAENPNANPGLAEVRFVGAGWSVYDNAMRTGVIGDYVEVAADCVGITVGSCKYDGVRNFAVYIDGAYDCEVLTSSLAGTGRIVAYTKTGLAPGRHIFKFVASQVGGASPVYLDYFDIIGTSATVDNIGTAEVSPRVVLEPLERTWNLDFAGKTAGSLVENKNKAGTTYDSATIMTTPVYAVEYGSSYRDMGTLNNINVSGINSTTNGHLYQSLFSFDLSYISADNSYAKAGLTELLFEYWGYGKGRNGSADDYQADLKAWNAKTSTWDALGTVGMSFARASVAYKSDGSQVPANAPRYEWGRFQNLLTANQSNVETDLTGWLTSIGNISYTVASLTRDTTEKFQEFASAKVVTSGTRTEGAGVKIAYATAGKTYICSSYIKAPAGVSMRINTAYSWNSSDKVGTAASVVGTGSWQRIFCIRTIDPSHIGAYDFRFGVYNSDLTPITYYMDALQIEEALPGQTAPSPWRPGGTGKAIMIEEGTTNLISGDALKFIGWTPYSGEGITLTQNISVPEWGATDATRIVGNGVGSSEIKDYLTIGIGNVGDIRSYSMYVKNQGTAQISINTKFAGKLAYINPGESKRIAIENIVMDGVITLQIQIRCNVATDNLDIIAWRPQLEAKPYATSWTDGTRQAEMCNTSCDGVAESQAGTVEFWAYISDRFKSTPTGPLFSIRTKDNSNYILALRSFNTNQLQLVTRNDSGSVTQAGTCSMPLVGWHAFAIKYTKGGNIVCFIDGVQQINFASNMESSFGKCYVGGNGATAGNIVVDNLRISNVARSDAEIAAAYASNAPLAWDANTTYLQDFDDSLGAVCPFTKALTANLGDYVDAANKVHLLAVSKYPADGTVASAVYTDYVRLRVKHCREAVPSIKRRGKNLLTAKQADIESGIDPSADGWNSPARCSAAADSSIAFHGHVSAQIAFNGQTDGFLEAAMTYSTLPGKTYTLSARVNIPAQIAGGFTLRVIGWNAAGSPVFDKQSSNLTKTSGWQLHTFTFTLPSNCASLSVRLEGGATTGNVWVDCLQLEEGDTATAWEMPDEIDLTYDALTSLLKGRTIIVDAEKQTAVDGTTNVLARMNTPFIVDGFSLKPGKNTLTYNPAAGSNGAMRARLLYTPKLS